uniref:Uncharacterized protein n=1 Tax=Oryza rufipogon TaxID=4529 RepID=A0A0E0RAT8_ORYRU
METWESSPSQPLALVSFLYHFRHSTSSREMTTNRLAPVGRNKSFVARAIEVFSPCSSLLTVTLRWGRKKIREGKRKKINLIGGSHDLGDAVNYLRGDEDYVGREITVDVRCGAHVKVKRAAELPDEVLVEELDGQNDCELTAVFRGEEAYLTAVFRGEEAYVEPAPGWEVRGEDAAEAYVERALSAVFRGEETHVERVPSEEELDGQNDCALTAVFHGEEAYVEPALGGEVRREHGEEVHVEPAPGGEVRREHGEEVHVEHVVVLDHEPVEATAGLVLGAPVPAAVRAAVLEARALKNMEGAKAAKEARKLWERGNLNGSNNGCNSNSPSPSEKRRFAGPKEKIFQKFDVEASYLTGNEDSDSKYRRLVDLFNQMISLMEAVEHGLSLEDSKDLEREMKSTIHEIRKIFST